MHYPSARARWLRWRARRCGECGLPLPCDEAFKDRVRERDVVQADRTGAWSTVYASAFLQAGRAGSLTPLQERRGHGGDDR